MKKQKILALIVSLIIVALGSGLTYSYFNSNANATGEISLAKFVFNTESLDALELSLTDLSPGNIEEHLFSITNDNAGTRSDVTLEYKMTISTYHYIPLLIELYSVVGEVDTLLLTCDETYERDLNNQVVCETPIYELGYLTTATDDYKLKITFPDTYKDEINADLVDFINIEINSWQKISE